jgi:hypothetical protein
MAYLKQWTTKDKMPYPLYSFWKDAEHVSLVGSGADFILGRTTILPNDWDFVCEPNHWQKVCADISRNKLITDVSMNHRGGINFRIAKEFLFREISKRETVQVQIWPQELRQFLIETPYPSSVLVTPHIGLAANWQYTPKLS